jgi:hypothetical protein
MEQGECHRANDCLRAPGLLIFSQGPGVRESGDRQSRAIAEDTGERVRARIVYVGFLLLASLAGEAVEVHAQVTISWSTNARSYRGRSEPFDVVCPPGGRAQTVWGSDVYTDDSSICTAAVHAGVITFAEGGRVVVEMKPGRGSYNGSRRNGVQTSPWEEYESSFSVSAYIEPPPPEPARPPPPPPRIGWDRTAVGLAPNGRRFTFRCAGGSTATPSPVMGTDVYAWDSSICTAAVHAGAITLANGGTVTIEMRPGNDRYTGSVRNGITSIDGESTILGFVVITDDQPRAAAGS